MYDLAEARRRREAALELSAGMQFGMPRQFAGSDLASNASARGRLRWGAGRLGRSGGPTPSRPRGGHVVHRRSLACRARRDRAARGASGLGCRVGAAHGRGHPPDATAEIRGARPDAWVRPTRGGRRDDAMRRSARPSRSQTISSGRPDAGTRASCLGELPTRSGTTTPRRRPTRRRGTSSTRCATLAHDRAERLARSPMGEIRSLGRA